MNGSCHIIVASAPPPPALLHRIYMGVAVSVLFEFYDYPLLLSILFCTWRPPPFPVELFSFPSPPTPPITAFASVYYEKETGKEEVSERGGWGWEERAREHERRGREGCRGVREKGKWLCACVSGSSAPWQIQCWCHWSCLMWRRVYLFSPLETHTVWKFSLFFVFTPHLLLLLSLQQLWCSGMFSCGHISIQGRDYFPPDQGHSLLASCLFIRLFCTFESNIKICCLVCSFPSLTIHFCSSSFSPKYSDLF